MQYSELSGIYDVLHVFKSGERRVERVRIHRSPLSALSLKICNMQLYALQHYSI